MTARSPSATGCLRQLPRPLADRRDACSTKHKDVEHARDHQRFAHQRRHDWRSFCRRHAWTSFASGFATWPGGPRGGPTAAIARSIASTWCCWAMCSTSWARGAGWLRPAGRGTTISRPRSSTATTGIVEEILRRNVDCIRTLRSLATEATVSLPPATAAGQPVLEAEEMPVAVCTHYMVGNRDWPLHLQGNTVRPDPPQGDASSGAGHGVQQAISARSGRMRAACKKRSAQHRVLARHGDIFDPLSFADDRDGASLSRRDRDRADRSIPAACRKRAGRPDVGGDVVGSVRDRSDPADAADSGLHGIDAGADRDAGHSQSHQADVGLHGRADAAPGNHSPHDRAPARSI